MGYVMDGDFVPANALAAGPRRLPMTGEDLPILELDLPLSQFSQKAEYIPGHPRATLLAASPSSLRIIPE
jgi:hypothetical protein